MATTGFWQVKRSLKAVYGRHTFLRAGFSSVKTVLSAIFFHSMGL